MAWYQVVNLVVTLVVSVLTLLGVGTITKIFWTERHNKKVAESAESKRRQQETRHQEITNAVSEIITPFAEQMSAAVRNIEDRLDASDRCDQAVLRNSLMNIYYDCAHKGYRTEDDSKNYREMHEAYRAIGGNSFIDSDVSRWFDQLPLHPNDYAANFSASQARYSRREKENDKKEKADVL